MCICTVEGGHLLEGNSALGIYVYVYAWQSRIEIECYSRIEINTIKNVSIYCSLTAIVQQL